METNFEQTASVEPKKHHPLTIALHWGTVFSIVVAVAAVLLREVIDDKFWRLTLIETHRQLGLLVLFGVAVRLGVRLRYGLADHMSTLPRLIRLAAFGAHCALYGLLVGLPLLGWATTNARNRPVNFVGLFQLPTLVDVNSQLADQLFENHIRGAWLLLGLVSLHAAAALYHHFVRHDRVLWAMLPSKSENASSEAPKTLPGNVVSDGERT